jgi:large subunit ribosomal protein L21
MYAIVENGSKQYKVEVGTVVRFEKINAEVGAKVELPVIMVSDEKGIKVGSEVKKFVAVGEVIEQGKDKKITVYKYKAKKNERKKQGHRQLYTAVKILEISAPKKTAKAKTEEEAK